MSAHTKGPWTVGGDRMTIININGARVIVGHAAQLPCIGGHDNAAAQRACDQEQANARLFAAAPELLAALRMNELRWADLAEIIRDKGPYDNHGFCTATAERCRAVIDKAEGKS